MPADLTAARAFVPVLGEALDQVPPYSFERRLEDEAKRNLALDNLRLVIERAGGQHKTRWDGAAVRIHGLRATSTSSLENACLNWMSQVTVKTGRERMAAGDSIGAWVPDGDAR